MQSIQAHRAAGWRFNTAHAAEDYRSVNLFHKLCLMVLALPLFPSISCWTDDNVYCSLKSALKGLHAGSSSQKNRKAPSGGS